MNIPRVFNAVRAAGSGGLLRVVRRRQVFIKRFYKVYIPEYGIVSIERNVYAFR